MTDDELFDEAAPLIADIAQAFGWKCQDGTYVLIPGEVAMGLRSREHLGWIALCSAAELMRTRNRRVVSNEGVSFAQPRPRGAHGVGMFPFKERNPLERAFSIIQAVHDAVISEGLRL